MWLHRDFGLRVANVFDTSEAARVLQLPNIGLAFLLNKFLGVRIDKSLRAEDWRRRPLPQAMVQYARADTHHLCALRSHMMQDLLELST